MLRCLHRWTSFDQKNASNGFWYWNGCKRCESLLHHQLCLCAKCTLSKCFPLSGQRSLFIIQRWCSMWKLGFISTSNIFFIYILIWNANAYSNVSILTKKCVLVISKIKLVMSDFTLFEITPPHPKNKNEVDFNDLLRAHDPSCWSSSQLPDSVSCR